MAEVPIQISGVLYDKTARTQRPVVLVGKASIVGLSVGGGPIVPPEESGPVDPGYGVEAPVDPNYGIPGPPPRPTHPIVLPPPTIWPPGPGIEVPEHPIVIPPPTDGKPEIPPGPIDWKAVWHPEYGWMVVGIPSGLHPSPSKR